MNDLERRKLAAVWEMANLGVMDLEDCQRKWNEVKARHGFAPDGTEKPQPASEGVNKPLAKPTLTPKQRRGKGKRGAKR